MDSRAIPLSCNPPGRIRLACLLASVLAVSCGDNAPSSVAARPTAATAPDPTPEVDIPETGIAAVVLAKWTGDLDGMIERRTIRVLTTHSKTHFFIDQGRQLG